MVRESDWTPAEDAVLRERFTIDPVVDLAARLGRSPEAVRRRACRLGIRRRPMGVGFRRDEPTQPMGDAGRVCIACLTGIIRHFKREPEREPLEWREPGKMVRWKGHPGT